MTTQLHFLSNNEQNDDSNKSICNSCDSQAKEANANVFDQKISPRTDGITATEIKPQSDDTDATTEIKQHIDSVFGSNTALYATADEKCTQNTCHEQEYFSETSSWKEHLSTTSD
jgi:hypothetical protein